MRKIGFRGLTKDGKLVYGDYVHIEYENSQKHFISDPKVSYPLHGAILSNRPVEVIPETVGQDTGLKDKNGDEIYEGDIIKTHFAKTKQYATYNEVGQVLLLGNLFNGVGIEDVKRCIHYKIYSHSEIIGNIHESPELLEPDKQ